jgi:hypothetical protein
MPLNSVAMLELTLFDNELAIERNELDIEDCLGLTDAISDPTLIHLCGAPTGATVEVYSDGQFLTFEVRHPTLIRSMNKVSVGHIGNRLSLVLELVDLSDDAPSGLGAVILWRIVRACLSLQIDRIFGHAVGGRFYQTPAQGERLAGYYAWPRFGFEAQITDIGTHMTERRPAAPALSGPADPTRSSLAQSSEDELRERARQAAKAAFGAPLNADD